MNTKNITAWIAQNKGKTALIALGIIVLTFDWFAIPRIIIMMVMPIFVFLIPLALLASPFIVLVLFLRRRSRAQQAAQQAENSFTLPDPTVPQAEPQAAPRRLTEPEIMDMYERFPERFEGVDLGDEIDRA